MEFASILSKIIQLLSEPRLVSEAEPWLVSEAEPRLVSEAE